VGHLTLAISRRRGVAGCSKFVRDFGDALTLCHGFRSSFPSKVSMLS